jgi:Flp pilus assembly protein TadD
MNEALRKKNKEKSHPSETSLFEPENRKSKAAKLRVYGLVVLFMVAGGLAGYFFYEYQSINQTMLTAADTPVRAPSSPKSPEQGGDSIEIPVPHDSSATLAEAAIDDLKTKMLTEPPDEPETSLPEPIDRPTESSKPAAPETGMATDETGPTPVIEPDGAEPQPVPKKDVQDGVPVAADNPEPDDDPVEERFYRKGLSYHRQNDFAAAIQMYQAALKKDPNHRDTRFNLASAYIQVGAYAEARAILEELNISEPRNPEILLNSAVAAIGLNRPDEALQLLEDAQEALSAPTFEIMFHKGAAYSRLGDFDQALAMYQRAGRISSDNPRLSLNKAIAYDHLQRYNQAVEQYEIYLNMNPDLHGTDRRSIENRLRELRAFLSNTSRQPSADSVEAPGQTE